MNWRENCKKAAHGIFPLDQYPWVFTCFELIIYVLSMNKHLEEIDIIEIIRFNWHLRYGALFLPAVFSMGLLK